MEQIAIVGIGCRFPGGIVDVPSFEDFLRRGGDAIGPVPASRWPDTDLLKQPQEGGFLADVDSFDALYFNIGPTEAAQLDPQQRFLLEVATDALNDAGIPAERLRGSDTGVFVGIYNNDYRLLAMDDPARVNSFTGMGTIHALAANRLSYFFDLRGPSVAIDATCASSLVAVHLACQSLALRESDIAIAGGVNLILSPLSMLSTSLVVAPAADFRCKTFDSRADGIVRSEGCGAVILKRVSDALRDGDRIYTVILGTGVNQDGRSNGLSAPNPEAQENLIRSVLRKAKVKPETVGYFEAHGTGTALGDPIEAEAIGRVMPHPLICGSVKTNLGHTEAAAGIAGLIKTALQIHSGFIAPHPHLKSIHPLIAELAPNIRIAKTLECWTRGVEPRRAAVSAFSLGGTNAHVLLEEAPSANLTRSVEPDPRRPFCLTISAADEPALRQAAADWVGFLQATGHSFASICYTAAARRTHHKHRIAVLATNAFDAAQGLAHWAEGKQHAAAPVTAGVVGQQPLLAFAFSGQGANWRGFSLELMETEPVFQSLLKRAAATVQRLAGWKLLDVIRDGFNDKAEYAQAAVFAIHAAFIELLRSWGVRPDAVIGHSLGEVTAAYAAEAIALDEALRLLVLRGRLSEKLGVEGSMAAVRLPEQEARLLAEGLPLTIACRNSVSSVTLAGSRQAIQELAARAESGSISCTVLRTNRPFHSLGMELAAAEFEGQAGPIASTTASVPWYSTVTGGAIEELDKSHWRRNLTDPVRFDEASQAMFADGYFDVLEFSPYPLLGGYLRETSAEVRVRPLLYGPRNQTKQIRELLCQLYVSGCDIKWQACFEGTAQEVIPLPRYPWQKKRFWLSSPEPVVPPFGYRVEWTKKRLLPAQAYEEAGSLIDRVCASYCEAALPEIEHGHPFKARMKEIVEISGSASGAKLSVEDVMRDNPELSAELSLLRRCGEALSGILNGRIAAVDIVFKGPEPAAVYRHSPFARHFHPLLADQLLREVKRRAGKQIRILEVGAGTCGATSFLVPLLAAIPGVRYFVTDKSRAFLPAARQEFGEYSWVEFGVLDLDEDFGKQGWEAGSFDLIIASNALHAARNVAGAAARLRALALDTGSLLLLEGTGNLNWADLTFGLTRGWDSFADPEIRGRGPLVCVPRWPEVLKLGGWSGPARVITGPGLEAAVICVACNKAPRSRRHWLLIGSEIPEAQALTCALELSGDSVETSLELSDVAEPGSETFVVFFQSGEPFSEPASADAKALIRLMGTVSKRREETRVWVVTRGAELSLSQELKARCGENDLAGAPLRGVARVFAIEQPDRWGGLIDGEAGMSGSLLAQLLLRACALTQLVGVDQFEDRIGVRQGCTYVPRLTRDMGRGQATTHLAPDSPCLITGGTGGIGIYLAHWLVQQGARHLVLAGRRGPDHPEAANRASELKCAGASRVDFVKLDVGDRQQVEDLIRSYDDVPVRAIFHIAGVVADGTLPVIRESDLSETMAAKAKGAWNLHNATARLDLSHFVMFSSAVTMVGMSGLAAYTAANEFLNELSSLRRAMGLPSQSIAWSGWNETGMAANAGAARAHQWKTLGLEALSVAEGIRGLDSLASGSAACFAWMNVQWDRYLDRFPAGRVPAFFSAFMKTAFLSAANQSTRRSSSHVLPRDEQAIRAFITEQIRGLCCDAPEQIREEDSLFDLGMDSLMSVELCNAVSRALNINVAPTALFDYTVFGDLILYLCKEAGIETESARAERVIETLSDSELRELELALRQ